MQCLAVLSPQRDQDLKSSQWDSNEANQAEPVAEESRELLQLFRTKLGHVGEDVRELDLIDRVPGAKGVQ